MVSDKVIFRHFEGRVFGSSTSERGSKISHKMKKGRKVKQTFASSGDRVTIDRSFASWANFRLLGEFPPLGRISASWANFRLLGDCLLWAFVFENDELPVIFGYF
jgi:hypothetical protein